MYEFHQIVCCHDLSYQWNHLELITSVIINTIFIKSISFLISYYQSTYVVVD